jgi:hypothetical protein
MTVSASGKGCRLTGPNQVADNHQPRCDAGECDARLFARKISYDSAHLL